LGAVSWDIWVTISSKAQVSPLTDIGLKDDMGMRSGSTMRL
jgi:hypothetical protein